jgi:hypothetical protein
MGMLDSSLNPRKSEWNYSTIESDAVFHLLHPNESNFLVSNCQTVKWICRFLEFVPWFGPIPRPSVRVTQYMKHEGLMKYLTCSPLAPQCGL